MSSTISNIKRERGISLEMLQWERASSCSDGGNLVIFLELRWDSQVTTGFQGASRVATGKSNLHSSCEGDLGMALESLQQIDLM